MKHVFLVVFIVVSFLGYALYQKFERSQIEEMNRALAQYQYESDALLQKSIDIENKYKNLCSQADEQYNAYDQDKRRLKEEFLSVWHEVVKPPPSPPATSTAEVQRSYHVVTHRLDELRNESNKKYDIRQAFESEIPGKIAHYQASVNSQLKAELAKRQQPIAPIAPSEPSEAAHTMGQEPSIFPTLEKNIASMMTTLTYAETFHHFKASMLISLAQSEGDFVQSIISSSATIERLYRDLEAKNAVPSDLTLRRSLCKSMADKASSIKKLTLQQIDLIRATKQERTLLHHQGGSLLLQVTKMRATHEANITELKHTHHQRSTRVKIIFFGITSLLALATLALFLGLRKKSATQA